MSAFAPRRPEVTDAAAAVTWLRTPEAIRERCGLVLRAAEAGATAHFGVDPHRLDPVAGYVVETMRVNYPDLQVPCHSRWRHFAAGGRDRWGELAARLTSLPDAEIARSRFDLALVSVLLDAGAGDVWRYVEPATGPTFARSEGLAVASFEAFARGRFSSRPEAPLRVDAEALQSLDERAMAEAFQVRPDNPLQGLGGRVALLNRLGGVLQADPERFGRTPRAGHLFDHLAAQAADRHLPARAILITLLDALAPIWPGRLELAGENLGDVGRHPAARADGPTDGLVPFHKLSQWLAYSLIEPLEGAGIAVTGVDDLTALAEYRNGGLLIDLGVLRPKHDGVLGGVLEPTSEVVVEWRALTVALIDRLAERVRAQLGRTPEQFPLALVLEGGTWSAGRQIAHELRAGGGPPLRIRSDGTLF